MADQAMRGRARARPAGRQNGESEKNRGAYAGVVLRGLRALGSALGADSAGVGVAGILLPWAAS